MSSACSINIMTPSTRLAVLSWLVRGQARLNKPDRAQQVHLRACQMKLTITPDETLQIVQLQLDDKSGKASMRNPPKLFSTIVIGAAAVFFCSTTSQSRQIADAPTFAMNGSVLIPQKVKDEESADKKPEARVRARGFAVPRCLRMVATRTRMAVMLLACNITW